MDFGLYSITQLHSTSWTIVLHSAYMKTTSSSHNLHCLGSTVTCLIVCFVCCPTRKSQLQLTNLDCGLPLLLSSDYDVCILTALFNYCNGFAPNLTQTPRIRSLDNFCPQKSYPIRMYRISALAPANPASGPFLEIRPNPAPARILTGFGAAVAYGNILTTANSTGIFHLCE